MRRLLARAFVVAGLAELRVYDASTGALRASWPAAAAVAPIRHHLYGEPNCRTPPTVTLDDASHGLAVYVANGEVHTLRLADGFDRDIGPGTVARFCDAGLVCADGARVRIAPS